MGIEAIVLLLVGLVGLIGIAGGSDSGDPEPENTDGENLPDGDMQPVDEIIEEAAPIILSGTSEDDELLGDEMLDGIDGAAGDDLIISFGAVGDFNGGEGNDAIVLSEGVGTLTGGEGADVFIVAGNEDADGYTIATVTDFDPDEDTLVLLMQQSFVGSGEVPVSPATAVAQVNEVETENGPATEILLEPRPGFEDALSSVGFPSVTLLGVKPAQISNDNVFIGSEESVTDPQFVELAEALNTGISQYGKHDFGTPSDDTEYSDSENDAYFGLGGNDTLFVQDFSATDLYGGSGDDTLYGPEFGGSGYGLFGGDGDDQFFTAGGTEITGGAGADEISVRVIEIGPGFTLPETVVTDFEVGVDTLSISANYGGDNFGLDVAASFEGETAVNIDDATRDGVSGTLVTTSFTVDGTTADGPSVFLVGVTAASIPDGAFSFSARSVF